MGGCHVYLSIGWDIYRYIFFKIELHYVLLNVKEKNNIFFFAVAY